MDPTRCLRVVLDGATLQEALNVTVPCAKLLAGVNGTANFTVSDHFDIVLYCYAVDSGIVTNGTLELNFTRFNHVVNNSKNITEAQRSILLG